jgi:hypothetical protein
MSLFFKFVRVAAEAQIFILIELILVKGEGVRRNTGRLLMLQSAI